MPDSTPHTAENLPLSRIAACAVIYLLAWTLLPALLGQSFALDVAESLSWGQELPLGTYKHPTFGPIVLNAFYMLFGKFGPYLLSQLCIALTLWMVWCTGRRLLDPSRALLGTVLTMGVTYYNFPAIEFNHNIAQMPLWAAIGYCFVAALQDGKLYQWVLLGVLAGLGMFTKYSIAVLLLALGLYVLCSAQYRRVLRTPGPWLAIVLMLLVFAPHLWWLQASDWLPFAYASDRSLAHGGNPRLEALGFPITQLAAHLPLLAVFGWACWRTRRTAAALAPVNGQRWHGTAPGLLLAMGLLPALIVIVLGVSMGLRLRDMWGSPMWAFSGLLLVALLPDQRLALMRSRLLGGIGLWMVLVTAFMVVYMAWGAQLRKRPARMDWPATTIAQQADAFWQQHTNCRLDVVASNYWLAGLISAYGSTRPSVLIESDPRYSPWVSAERLRQHGALWVWQESTDDTAPQPPEPLARLIAEGVFQSYDKVTEIAWPTLPRYPALKLHWQVYLPTACVR